MNEFQNQLQNLNVDDFQVTQPVPWEQNQYNLDDSSRQFIGVGGCFGCFGCFLCFGCFGCGRCGRCGRCGGCGGRCGRCGRCGG
ncbi:heterocycloanthracin/sonorensin family bacteriocin [Peribacillus sp. V2I11]|uniref:heterocycloanthracin/sonorensin family bacteriocin n=1 Tax=Peribacillus sp. V2I11 TaxID=3042277 RepID=UPI0027D84D87|nr:heterocycloanthracin/sonorensin family bacteriocin [Peribacillus sp. V2I11]